MTAKEFYNSRAIKRQLKRAIKHDKQYFEDAIIELMEMYAQEQVKNLTIPVVSQQSELLKEIFDLTAGAWDDPVISEDLYNRMEAAISFNCG